MSCHCDGADKRQQWQRLGKRTPLTEPVMALTLLCIFFYLTYSSQHGEYDWAKGIISSIFWASYPLLCRLPLKQPQIQCLPLPSITFPTTGTCLPLQPPFAPSCPLPTLRSSSKTPYQAESDFGAFCSYFSSVGNAFPSLPLIFTWKMPA